MDKAKEVVVLDSLTTALVELFLSRVAIIPTDNTNKLACPKCQRVYGTQESFPALNHRRALVKCPCGHYHVGIKPFSGYH